MDKDQFVVRTDGGVRIGTSGFVDGKVVLHERKLNADAGIKVIEEIAPAFKNRVLILILCQLIVDVIKTDSLGVQMFLHPADSIASHLQVRDRSLHRQVLFVLLFRFCLCRRLEELLEDAAEQRVLILFASQ